MITFKCKMCGGDLEFEQGATVVECSYCGSKQTLPKLNNDRRANMYDRANHFRRQNEYNKAMAIYEQILQEDRTDAEAYWSLVLCRYGIEYVEDPGTHKRIPTVNRVQYASIMADEDYQSALQYADSVQRSVYEAEANAIAVIQKCILDISKQEKPFDVFICYKETDAKGRRTPDSVLANDLYHQLTNEGYNVFFSRITLEDKIGTAYEPYIFAALNSAKVMVVIGTKPEYFNAVWVKNEWSRYLALIRAGADKVLVPAYRDMDPYDLPDEFAHLQAQDMSKLGFMQDLIRGIEKITSKEEVYRLPVVQQTVVSGGATVESLMKRAKLFMEDNDFASANEYLDKVLDIDPEFAAAYVGKVQVALGLSKESDLESELSDFESNSNWKKAIRFSSAVQRIKFESYVAISQEKREENRKKGIYENAVQQLLASTTTSECDSAKAAFASISGYKDAEKKQEECDIKQRKIVEEREENRKKGIYENAVQQFLASTTTSECDSAKAAFASISGYKDAEKKQEECDIKRRKIVEEGEKKRIYHEQIENLVSFIKNRKLKKTQLYGYNVKEVDSFMDRLCFEIKNKSKSWKEIIQEIKQGVYIKRAYGLGYNEKEYFAFLESLIKECVKIIDFKTEKKSAKQ